MYVSTIPLKHKQPTYSNRCISLERYDFFFKIRKSLEMFLKCPKDVGKSSENHCNSSEKLYHARRDLSYRHEDRLVLFWRYERSLLAG